MSQVKIKKLSRVVTATVATTTGVSTTLRLEDMTFAAVQLPTITTNASSIQVWGNTTDTGTFAQLYNSGGTAASITLTPSTVNQTMYSLPDAVFAVPYIKLVAANANSTATVSVLMKS